MFWTSESQDVEEYIKIYKGTYMRRSSCGATYTKRMTVFNKYYDNTIDLKNQNNRTKP